MTTRPTIVVAGAGLAGLSAAIALCRAGHAVTVCERAAAPAATGYGIQLGPSATHILQGWGLMPALTQVALQPERLVLRDAASGQQIASHALSSWCEARFGTPYVTLQRSALAQLLLDGARDAGAQLLWDARVLGWRSGARHVSVFTAAGEIRASALVIAEGVASDLMRALDTTSRIAPSRFTAWRAFVPGDAEPNVTIEMHPRGHAVRYGVTGGTSVVAITSGDDAGLAERLADRPRLTRWPLGRMVAQSWTVGPVAAIGDAAHALEPFAAAGAVMAIEDAAALAGCLTRYPVIPEAFAAWETLRRPRISRLTAAVLQAERLFHAGGLLRQARNAALRAVPSLPLRRNGWLYGFRGEG